MNASTLTRDHAVDNLRSAQLRRQLEEEGSGIFVHAPRPAVIPAATEHRWQRSFGPGPANHVQEVECIEREAKRLNAKAAVWRNGYTDFADLTLSLGIHTCAELKVRLHPAELRDLAARLIDAAHDIEAHPAATPATDREAA